MISYIMIKVFLSIVVVTVGVVMMLQGVIWAMLHSVVVAVAV